MLSAKKLKILEDPLTKPHVNAAAMTYEAAHNPEYMELAVVTSHLTEKKINRFTDIHQSTIDLMKKVKLLRMLGQRTGTCFQHCVGFDALNAVYSTCFDMDTKLGTHYYRRFCDYLLHIQEADTMVAGSISDPKGDRSLLPSKQADPDMYVHMVDKNVDKNREGIVIRGAQAHQTGIANSHEFLLMPTMALRQEDTAYAVACSVPVDALKWPLNTIRVTSKRMKITSTRASSELFTGAALSQLPTKAKQAFRSLPEEHSLLGFSILSWKKMIHLVIGFYKFIEGGFGR